MRKHALDDLHRRLHVRHRAVVPAPALRLSICGRGSKRQQQKSFQEIHQAILSNGPPSYTEAIELRSSPHGPFISAPKPCRIDGHKRYAEIALEQRSATDRSGTRMTQCLVPPPLTLQATENMPVAPGSLACASLQSRTPVLFAPRVTSRTALVIPTQRSSSGDR